MGDDLRSALVGPIAEVRRNLRSSRDRRSRGRPHSSLWTHRPSSCHSVQLPTRRGAHPTRQERENYGVTYREAQQAIEGEVPGEFDARSRAYLLLKHHGQTICKRANPKCPECPVSLSCSFFAGKRRGRSSPS